MRIDHAASSGLGFPTCLTQFPPPHHPHPHLEADVLLTRSDDVALYALVPDPDAVAGCGHLVRRHGGGDMIASAVPALSTLERGSGVEADDTDVGVNTVAARATSLGVW